MSPSKMAEINAKDVPTQAKGSTADNGSSQSAKASRHLNAEGQISSLAPELIQKMVANALEEDVRDGDINAKLVKNDTKTARVITREDVVVCGTEFVKEVFRQVDPQVKVEFTCKDGDRKSPNEVLFTCEGPAASILTAERNALNYLQMLSGTATITAKYVEAVKKGNEKTNLLDTRKTVPGFRLAQKYAVHCGGGVNHRIGLFDAFLIKENHIASCNNSITEAVKAANELAPNKLVEVEVENFEQLEEAISAGANVCMLDNFSIPDTKKAVEQVNGRIVLEASGNVTIETIGDVAATGVDYISVGALTKHVKAADLSMRMMS